MALNLDEINERLNLLKQGVTDFKKDLSDFAHSKGVYFLNPYVKAGTKVAKCNFHCHTVNSDGNLEPLTLLQTYKNMSYDLVGIADHWNITEVENPPLLTTLGCESSRNVRTEHWLMINIPKQEDVSPEDWELIQSIKAGGKLMEEYAKECRKLGILSSLTHPRWECEDYWKAKYDFYSICNYGGKEKGNHEWMLNRILSRSNNRAFLIIDDDEHGTPSNSDYRAYNRIFYNGEKTVENILNGLKRGQVICCIGTGNLTPIITSVTFEGTTINVKTNRTADIDIIYGEASAMASFTSTNSVTYQIPDDKKYVRVKAYYNKASYPHACTCFSQVFWRI